MKEPDVFELLDFPAKAGSPAAVVVFDPCVISRSPSC